MSSPHVVSETLVPAEWGPIDKDTLPYEDDTSQESDPSFFFQQDDELDDYFRSADGQQEAISMRNRGSSGSSLRQAHPLGGHAISGAPNGGKGSKEQPSLASISTFSTENDHEEVNFSNGYASDASSLSWHHGTSFDNTEPASKSGCNRDTDKTEARRHSLWGMLRLNDVVERLWQGSKEDVPDSAIPLGEDARETHTGFCSFADHNEPQSYTFDENEIKIMGPVEETKSEPSASARERTVEGNPESWSFLGSLAKLSLKSQSAEEEIVFGNKEEKVDWAVDSTIAETTSRVKNLLGKLKRSSNANMQSVKLDDSFAKEDCSILQSVVEDGECACTRNAPIRTRNAVDETGRKPEGALSQLTEKIAALGIAACAVGADPQTGVADDESMQSMAADPQADGVEGMASQTLLEMTSRSNNTIFEDPDSVASMHNKNASQTFVAAEDFSIDEGWANFEVAFPELTIEDEIGDKMQVAEELITEVPYDNGNIVIKTSPSEGYLALEADIKSIVTATTADESKSTITRDYKPDRATRPIYDDSDLGFEVAFSSLALLWVDPVNVKDCEDVSQVYVRKDELPSLMDQEDDIVVQYNEDDIVVQYNKDELKYLSPPSRPTGKVDKAKQNLSRGMLRLRRRFSGRKIEV